MTVSAEDIKRIVTFMNGSWTHEEENEKIIIDLNHPKSIRIRIEKEGNQVLDKEISGGSMWVEDYLWFHQEDSPYFLKDATESELVFGEFAQRGIIGPSNWIYVFQRVK